jgi:RecB family exonuclease
LDVATEITSEGERIIVIRTSDRILFRRCRRLWNWQSHLRNFLEPIENAEPLWTGTGFHFALEDFHGHRRFETPAHAFRAFRDAGKKTPGYRLPPAWIEQTELACSMLDYYLEWLRNRPHLTTFVLNGEYQCEVRFEIPLPIKGPNGERVIYRGTLDRVAVDGDGQLWIVEYKTAKKMETGHFMLDTQISAYMWAGSLIYQRPIAGVIYQQHKKQIPHAPDWLKTKKMFSVNKQQATTWTMYRAALVNLYGDVQSAPKENVDFLDFLATQEDSDHDDFVRRDWVYRNEYSIGAEANKILLELEDMLNPNLPLYNNPTRDCSWQCASPFQSACVSMDDGGDWEFELQKQIRSRDKENDTWRQYLQLPEPLLNRLSQPPQVLKLAPYPPHKEPVKLLPQAASRPPVLVQSPPPALKPPKPQSLPKPAASKQRPQGAWLVKRP